MKFRHFVFTRATLASAGISCCRVSVRLSVSHKSSVLLKQLNVGSRKQRHTIASDSSFLMPKISTKIKRGRPNGGAKCRWGTLDAAEVADNDDCRVSTRSVVILARSQICHTFAALQCVARQLILVEMTQTDRQIGRHPDTTDTHMAIRRSPISGGGRSNKSIDGKMWP